MTGELERAFKLAKLGRMLQKGGFRVDEHWRGGRNAGRGAVADRGTSHGTSSGTGTGARSGVAYWLGKETPDVAGVVTGWRVWLLSSRDGLLHSTTMLHVAWPTDEPLHAQHGVGHPAPQPSCSCGIYATAAASETARYSRTLRALGRILNPPAIFVTGRVDLWGRIVRHERGYRAEYARPAAFVNTWGSEPVDCGYRTEHLRQGWNGDLVSLARRYGVPLEKSVL